jgi:hypothetical protein
MATTSFVRSSGGRHALFGLILSFLALLLMAPTATAALKPYRVLLVAGTQMRDATVIHDAYDFGDIAALLKLWGVPFDILRLDLKAMAAADFVDAAGQARYGAVIWTARQDQYPWQPQDYAVLRTAVRDKGISLIAVGNKIQEPLIQDLLGVTYRDFNAIADPVRITRTDFVSRGLVNQSVPAAEAFAGGLGPQVTARSGTVTLASAGQWPQLTVRTVVSASRTRAVWLGGHPDFVFRTSPIFIKLMRRSLVWAIGHAVYKDYGRSMLLRMDDPGGAQSAYLGSWHSPQLSQATIKSALIDPLKAHGAKLGVAINPGYPWIPDRSIRRSGTVDFVDPFGTRQNVISTWAGLRDGIAAGVLEVHSHGVTHMVPDLETPIAGSTNWWDGSITGEWADARWYREFYDTRREQEIDAATQRARLTQSSDWIATDFSARPLVFVPPGHAISDAEEGPVVSALRTASLLTAASRFPGKPPQAQPPLPARRYESTPAGAAVGTGQAISGQRFVEPAAQALARTAAAPTIAATAAYTPPRVAENYTYKLAAEAGYGLALDDVAHFLSPDRVVTLGQAVVNNIQTNFDRGVPADDYFHDLDIVNNPGLLPAHLSSIKTQWPDVAFMSMDEWVGYLHARLETTQPSARSLELRFRYDQPYGRYFSGQPSRWTLHLSDEVRSELRGWGWIDVVVDGTVTQRVFARHYFAETQTVTIPKGAGSHTMVFRPR